MDMEGLLSFITVVREKSISRAAQILHVTQPTLSIRLRKLEEGLGVTLLERDWKGIGLTKEGRFFLSYSIQLLHELEEASTLLRKHKDGEADHPLQAGTDQGRLKIGVELFYHPALMKPILEGIRTVAPDIECRFVHKHSDGLLNLMDGGGLDICIHMPYGPYARYNPKLILHDKLVILVPKDDYLHLENNEAPWTQLQDKPFVLFESTPLLRYEEITRHVFTNMYGGRPKKFHIVGNVEDALEIVSQGLGHTFLPGTSISHLAGKPLPFHITVVNHDYFQTAVYISSLSESSSPYPIASIVNRIHDCLAAQVSEMYSKLSSNS